MKKTFCIILIHSFLLNWCVAQPQKLSKASYGALNNYMEYSNEVVHALNIMHADFVYLNKQFNQYIEEDSISIVVYRKENILTNYDFFPVLVRDLYNDIFDDNIFLPYEKRGKPLQLAGKMHNVLNEIDKTRTQLDKYIQSKSYQQDSVLETGYKYLRRMEVLYYDVFTLQEKIHWNLTSIIKEFKRFVIDENNIRAINRLQPLITHSKRLIKSVRAQDVGSSLAYECDKFTSRIRDLRVNKATHLSDIAKIDSIAQCPHKRYDSLLVRATFMVKTVRKYNAGSITKYNNRVHDPFHYIYNNELLGAYNRYGDGLVALFNKWVTFSGEYWLWEYELPAIFEVDYPAIPEYNQFNKDSLPDPEELMKQWQARQDSIAKAKTDADSIYWAMQDSLKADSIANANKEPELGDPTLDGFATNNLVFLLDVSSSMNQPEKLPLLKSALGQLLELMRPEDNITLIAYSGKAKIILPPTSAEKREYIMEVVNKLKSESTSDADKGLQLAYEVAMQSFIPSGNNRIILATDGGFKLKRKTKRLIKRSAKRELLLSTFYFSKKEFQHNKKQLEGIALWGGGKYSYLQEDNAQKTLLIEAQAVRKSKLNQ
ncbi:MAG: VWA domain-containing protein [Aureispira sp.]|nr:VWA domain-containing protein [Aureispira sp.]